MRWIKRPQRLLQSLFVLGVVLFFAGCQTPERRTALERMDRLQAENSALQATAQTETAQVRMALLRERNENLRVIESLNGRIDELAQKVDRQATAAPAPAPAPSAVPPPVAPEERPKPSPGLPSELALKKAENQAQMEREQELIAKSQAQAEAAKLAMVAVDKRAQEAGKDLSWKGQKLPLAKFVDSSGKLVDLAQFTGKSPVVLVVMKGFYSQGVCVYCTRQTAQLAKQMQSFRDLHAEVLVVYPGGEEHINAFVRSIREYEKSDDPRFKLPFKVLLDVNQDSVRALRIDGDLAHPTSFVLDKEGIVQFQYTGRSISDRPKADALLEVLRKFGDAKP